MNDKDRSTTKITIWTAVITGVVTVLTAFIGVVPKMRQGDKQQIQQYQQQIEQMKQRLAKTDTYAITGFVKTKKNNTPLADAVLVAAPASYSSTLDDEGKFYFSRMNSQPYFIVLQNQTGQMTRVLITPGVPETDTDDLAITYTFSQLSQK